MAEFNGMESSKTVYRDYLSDRYGMYKMTFSGIHVNYSFAEELLKKEFERTDLFWIPPHYRRTGYNIRL